MFLKYGNTIKSSKQVTNIIEYTSSETVLFLSKSRQFCRM